MSKIILTSLVSGAVFAGAVGFQLAHPPQDAAAMVTTLNSSDGGRETLSSPNDPVVVELFTSQGCSSCPPADLLASRLAKDPSILVITRPVTYWDRLGWKDTLAREDNTRLQRDYARKGLAGAGVYTPQIVVDGGDGTVGSRERTVRSMVRAARHQGGPNIKLANNPDGTVRATVSGKSEHLARVSLIALSTSETVKIGRGENRGRTVHYTNVVRAEQPLGSWTGGSEEFQIPHEYLQIANADSYALVVQRPGAGRIVAAAKLDI